MKHTTTKKRGFDPRAVIKEEEEKLGPLKCDQNRGEYYYRTPLSELFPSKSRTENRSNEEEEKKERVGRLGLGAQNDQ